LLQVSHLPSAESSAEYSPPKTVAAMRCGNMAVAVWAVAVPSCDHNRIDHHPAVRSAGSPGSIIRVMLWTRLDGLSAVLAGDGQRAVHLLAASTVSLGMARRVEEDGSGVIERAHESGADGRRGR
jgi:hypothetical protein